MEPAASTPRPGKWQIPRMWAGRTVYLIGGGPSLSSVDLERLRGRPTIVINRSFRLAPWASMLYFCDRAWWLADGAEVCQAFAGLIVSCAQISHARVNNVLNTGRQGLEARPWGVRHGTNSGYQAINVAYHTGAARIVLLGYDMRVVGAQTHAHGGYGTPAATVAHNLAKRMLPYFDFLVKPLADAGVEVLNATEGSAIECFPRVNLDTVLNVDSGTIAATGEEGQA